MKGMISMMMKMDSVIKLIEDTTKEVTKNVIEQLQKDYEKYKPIRLEESVRELKVDDMFRNYKHLFVTLGLQEPNSQLSGYDRKMFFDMVSQFARIEKMKDNCDLLIVREIYEK